MAHYWSLLRLMVRVVLQVHLQPVGELRAVAAHLALVVGSIVVVARHVVPAVFGFNQLMAAALVLALKWRDCATSNITSRGCIYSGLTSRNHTFPIFSCSLWKSSSYFPCLAMRLQVEGAEKI